MLFLLIFICFTFLVAPMPLRGGALHNFLINQSANFLRRLGVPFFLEYPLRLQNGTTDYIDLLIHADTFDLACEFETTERHILDNAAKAQDAHLVLWVIVPNEIVHKRVARKLEGTDFRPDGVPIRIFLIGQLFQELTTVFPRHITEKPMEKAANKKGVRHES